MRIRKTSDTMGRRKLRFSPAIWGASLLAGAIVSLSVTGTLSQFTASITNDQNHVQTAGADAFGFSESLVVDGTVQTPACQTASAGQALTCSTINKYGVDGQPATPIAPGTTQQTTVRLENTVQKSTPGGLSGDLTLTVGPCTNVVLPAGTPPPAGTGDLCSALMVTISCSGEPAFSVGPVTMTALASTTPYAIQTSIPPEGFVDCTFTTELPATATAVDLQDVQTSQDLTWTWTQST